MKARKIDLSSYKVTIRTRSNLLEKILTTPGVDACMRDSTRWGKEELDNLLQRRVIMKEYEVKESILEILFGLRIAGKEAWQKRDPLCKKIQLHNGHVLLDTEEYAMLLKTFEQFQGAGRNEEELLKRVFEAEEVEMEEKKEKKK